MNELCHHGVKGQRWGVRRYRNADGSLTPEGRKRYRDGTVSTKQKEPWPTSKKIAVGAAVAGGAILAIGALYVHNSHKKPPVHIISAKYGKDIDLKALSDKDRVIPAKRMYRMSSKSVEELAENGRTYVTYKLKDRTFYKDYMPHMFKQWANRGIISDDGTESYEHVLHLKHPVKVASPRAVAEAYMTATGINHVDELRYSQFMANLVNRNNSEVTKFFNVLKGMGYDAISDENDAGWTRDPLILINPRELVELDKSHKVGSVERAVNTLFM